MFYQPDLFDAVEPPVLSLPDIIGRIAGVSRRPRYAFMVLNLIARVADATGRAGPQILVDGTPVPVRDWLCDALMPMAQRDPRRIAIVNEVRDDLLAKGTDISDPAAARRLLEDEVKQRVRQSGRCNVSRAVSDLVRAGLVRRHYQGYRVDHHNRGGQREAVYSLTASARQALHGG